MLMPSVSLINIMSWCRDNRLHYHFGAFSWYSMVYMIIVAQNKSSNAGTVWHTMYNDTMDYMATGSTIQNRNEQ